MTKYGRRLARNASIVAGATLVSRLFGFARDVIVAFALGAGMFADAFFVAFRVPNLLRRLFAEGSLTMAFIPIYTRVREEEGEEAAHAMARSAAMWLALILGVVTVVVELAAGPLTFAIAPGFADNPELFGLTVRLVRICFPYIMLISGVALCMGVLNASDRFLTPALAPVMLNVALIAAALAAYGLDWNVAVGMSWGVLAGGVLQFALQQPALTKSGFAWSGPRSWRNPAVRRMAILMLPTVFGAAVYQFNILFGTLLASFLPEGSVSYLYYADRLVQFPLGVFGMAVSTAALPRLSSLAAAGNMEDFNGSLRAALGLTLFICLPSMAGLMALADPIIALLFQRGAFTGEAVRATASALLAYSWGLPFIALSRPLVAAFYALQDTKTPVKIAVACLAVNIGLGAALMPFWAHVGLAAAVSVSSAANFGLLLLFLGRATGTVPMPLSPALKCCLLSLGVYLAARWSVGGPVHWLAVIPVLAVLYIFAGHALGMDEARMFADIFRSRLRRS